MLMLSVLPTIHPVCLPVCITNLNNVVPTFYGKKKHYLLLWLSFCTSVFLLSEVCLSTYILSFNFNCLLESLNVLQEGSSLFHPNQKHSQMTFVTLIYLCFFIRDTGFSCLKGPDFCMSIITLFSFDSVTVRIKVLCTNDSFETGICDTVIKILFLVYCEFQSLPLNIFIMRKKNAWSCFHW